MTDPVKEHFEPSNTPFFWHAGQVLFHSGNRHRDIVLLPDVHGEGFWAGDNRVSNLHDPTTYEFACHSVGQVYYRIVKNEGDAPDAKYRIVQIAFSYLPANFRYTQIINGHPVEITSDLRYLQSFKAVEDH